MPNGLSSGEVGREVTVIQMGRYRLNKYIKCSNFRFDLYSRYKFRPVFPGSKRPFDLYKALTNTR